jgi:transcriptional regulator with XRE-family HTH domain
MKVRWNEAVSDLLVKAGRPQHVLADRCGLTRETVNRYLKGRRGERGERGLHEGPRIRAKINKAMAFLTDSREVGRLLDSLALAESENDHVIRDVAVIEDIFRDRESIFNVPGMMQDGFLPWLRNRISALPPADANDLFQRAFQYRWQRVTRHLDGAIPNNEVDAVTKLFAKYDISLSEWFDKEGLSEVNIVLKKKRVIRTALLNVANEPTVPTRLAEESRLFTLFYNDLVSSVPRLRKAARLSVLDQIEELTEWPEFRKGAYTREDLTFLFNVLRKHYEIEEDREIKAYPLDYTFGELIK